MSFKIFILISIILHLSFLFLPHKSNKKNENSVKTSIAIENIKSTIPFKKNKESTVESKGGDDQLLAQSSIRSDMVAEKLLFLELDYPSLAVREGLEAKIPVEIVIKEAKILNYKIQSHNFHQIFNQVIDQAMTSAKVKENVGDGTYHILIIFKLNAK